MPFRTQHGMQLNAPTDCGAVTIGPFRLIQPMGRVCQKHRNFSAEARDKAMHANEATTTEDPNAKRKNPTRTDNDEEVSQAIKVAKALDPHTLPERNSGTR